MRNKDEAQKKWAEIVAKAWTDEKFKKELLANPEKVCKEYGIDLEGKDCEVVENTNKKLFFVVPEKPTDGLSEEDLKKIAGADTYSVSF